MKCKLIKPASSPNPAWDADEELAAVRAGKVYPEPRSLTLEPGHEIEHPQAWKHCISGALNKPPIAVPVDDDCRAKVNQALKNRKLGIQNLHLVLQGQTPRTPEQKQWHDQLRQAYAEDLYKLNSELYPLPTKSESGKPKADS